MYREQRVPRSGVHATVGAGGRGMSEEWQCTEFERGRVIGMLEAGMSQREVSAILGRSRCTIQRWWNRWVEEGNCVRRSGSGRPRSTSIRDDRHLRHLIVRAPLHPTPHH